MPGLPVGVLPTFVLVGPLALLALIFPAVFGGLALVLRRWAVLLAVGSACSLFYLAHFWLRGAWQGTWWATPAGLWLPLAAAAGVGLARSAWRHRPAPRPRALEPALLALATAAGLVGLFWVGSRWGDLRVFAVVAGVGLVHSLVWASLPQTVRGPRLASETVMLTALLLACLGRARPADDESPQLPTARVAWMFEQPERGAVIATPVVAGDRVYVAAIRDTTGKPAGVVYALDRATGKPVWRFDDGGRMLHMYSSPCLADGRLYVGEGMHANFVCKLYCLDAATGQKRWDHPTRGHIESTPCVAGGKVYFGAGDDGLYCLDAVTGKEVWHFREPVHIDTNPLVVDGRLYIGSGESRTQHVYAVFCLDATTGRELWRASTSLPVWGSPAVDGRHVYVGTGNGRLTESARPPETPAGALVCLDRDSGHTLWRFPTGDGLMGRPTVADGRVIFGARDGTCYALDADGQELWKVALGSPVVTTITAEPGRLVVAPAEGPLVCLDAATGRTLWSFDPAALTRTRPRLLATPVVCTEGAGRRVYLAAELRNPLTSAAVVFALDEP